MKRSISAGGVVINEDKKVVIVRQEYNKWSLPKGKIGEGEDLIATAKREIAEETGLKDITYVEKLGRYKRHKIGKGDEIEDKSELKTIHMFLFKTKQTVLKPSFYDVKEAKWVDIKEVAKMLSHLKDRKFFESIIGKIKE